MFKLIERSIKRKAVCESFVNLPILAYSITKSLLESAADLAKESTGDRIMPRVGMEKVRKQQLIEATLSSIELHGLQGTTIVTISKIAGVSSGIISHYFGGKAGLLEACVHFLLQNLQHKFLNNLSDDKLDHKSRLYAIIDTNFDDLQQSSKAAVTWLAFWNQSMHNPELARLQTINANRLVSNLRYSLKHLVAKEQVNWCADMIAAQIDGVWLRAALSKNESAYKTGSNTCKRLIDQVLRDYPRS